MVRVSIIKQPQGWQVTVYSGDSAKATIVCATKQDALAEANHLARVLGPGVLITEERN